MNMNHADTDYTRRTIKCYIFNWRKYIRITSFIARRLEWYDKRTKPKYCVEYVRCRIELF